MEMGTQTHREGHGEVKGRDWCDESVSQGHQALLAASTMRRRAGSRFSLRNARRNQPSDHRILDYWPPELRENTFLLCGALSFCYLVKATLGH